MTEALETMRMAKEKVSEVSGMYAAISERLQESGAIAAQMGERIDEVISAGFQAIETAEEYASQL